MDHLDEKILDMINQVEEPVQAPSEAETAEEKKAEERTIYSGIKIAGKRIEFEPRSFADGKIIMMTPSEFTEMKAEKAKIKYPSEQRPETILTDYTGTINLLFSPMDNKLDNDDTEKFRDQVFGMMRRVNPGIKSQSTGEEVISGKKVAYVEFSNPAMDGKLYNLMFFLETAGQPLMVSFNCRTKEMKYWKEPAFQMMRSVQLVEQLYDGEECETDGNTE